MISIGASPPRGGFERWAFWLLQKLQLPFGVLAAASSIAEKGGSRAAFLFVVTRSLQLSYVRAVQPHRFCCRGRYSDTRAGSEIPDRPRRGRIGSPRNPASAPRPGRG